LPQGLPEKIQLQRLRHAHQHADLCIATDDQTPEQILAQVLDFLTSKNLA